MHKRLIIHDRQQNVSWDIAYAEQLALVEALQQSCEDECTAHLILLEHEPTFTLGRMTRPEHLPYPIEYLAQKFDASIRTIDRGGSITYHGPGQLTVYLLLHLKRWGLEIHRHLACLEQVTLKTLRAFDLQGCLVEGMTGVWIERPEQEAAKICAIGIGCKRWVTYHGLALNVDLDLAPFESIDPCGLGHKPVTSLSAQLGRTVSISSAKSALIESVRLLYGIDRIE